MDNDMRVNEKIRQLREKLGITQKELAQKVGVDQTTISYYEAGKRSITVDMLQKIADALGVDVRYFFEDQEVEPIFLKSPQKSIPLYDTNMTAGNGVCPDSIQPLKYISADITNADCAFIVHGKSMEPEISEGDIVLVKHVFPDEIQNGDIVVLMYNNQFLVKRFYKTDGTIVLVSENEEYSPIVIDSKENIWYSIFKEHNI
jgi:repressor LexA